MNAPNYLIDTNVFIGLEDSHEVSSEFSSFIRLAAKHQIGVFVHEAARDDIARDNDVERRRVSLSKIAKFQLLKKVRGLTDTQLADAFGPLRRPNDVVDATLLHSLQLGVADFFVTEDRGLHDRARKHAPELSRRILYIADAVQLLQTTYEPVDVPLRFVEEMDAHTIPLDDGIFDSLREGYPEFDDWWREKCVKKFRKCWVVTDQGTLAGIVVRKDESQGDTDARLPGQKILKVCTFKVVRERRGVKLGELLLKQILWFAQNNGYDVVYLSTYDEQSTLIDFLEYYGFENTYQNDRGELIYEKSISREKLTPNVGQSFFDAARLNYPRFCSSSAVKSFAIPIKEAYHEVLFPELADRSQPDLFEFGGVGSAPRRPGNTIRKVYLCRAQANIDQPGSILLFYKGKSVYSPSQAITTVGIFEDSKLAHSTEELRRLAGGRSVYSERQIAEWAASPDRPVKVINFLLAGHISPPMTLDELVFEGVFGGYPPQSISRLSTPKLRSVLDRVNFGFDV
jgi:GNAT superfamily N-acetyltransferase